MKKVIIGLVSIISLSAFGFGIAYARVSPSDCGFNASPISAPTGSTIAVTLTLPTGASVYIPSFHVNTGVNTFDYNSGSLGCQATVNGI